VSVRAMREEVGTGSVPNAPGWSRIVFIAAVCALGGIGFLAATILMNGRALSFNQRSTMAQVVETPATATVPDSLTQTPAKPKPALNDRFQPVDFVPRAEINKAALARCRSHVEAGRPFESLSLKRITEMREAKKTGNDPETVCLDYFAAEAKQAAGR
jgi:hypothetical protein